MLLRKKQVAAMIEVVPGVAETILASGAAILPVEPKFTPNINMFERNYVKDTLTPSGKLTGIRTATFPFKLELRGSGATGTEPTWSRYAQACGLRVEILKRLTVGAIAGGPFQHNEVITQATSEAVGRVMMKTVNATTALYVYETSGTFNGTNALTGGTSGATATASAVATVGFVMVPESSDAGMVSLTMAEFMDGTRKIAKGCRGKLNLNFNAAGEPCMMDYEFMGVFQGLTDTALLTGITHQTTLPPTWKGTTFSLDAHTPRLMQMDISLGNSPAALDDATDTDGVALYRITKRDWTVSFLTEMVLVDTYDYFGKWTANTKVEIKHHLGSVAGNQFTFYMPYFQIANVEEQDKDGIAAIQVSGDMTGTDGIGDDEFALLIL